MSSHCVVLLCNGPARYSLLTRADKVIQRTRQNEPFIKRNENSTFSYYLLIIDQSDAKHSPLLASNAHKAMKRSLAIAKQR